MGLFLGDLKVVVGFPLKPKTKAPTNNDTRSPSGACLPFLFLGGGFPTKIQTTEKQSGIF